MQETAFQLFLCLFSNIFPKKSGRTSFLYVQVGMYLAAEATGRLISVPTLVNNQWSSHCFQWSCLSDITSRNLSEVVADLVIIINYFRSMLMIGNIMFSNHVIAKTVLCLLSKSAYYRYPIIRFDSDFPLGDSFISTMQYTIYVEVTFI